ncbi:MAG: RnfABCDGE type electron transport complex subunit B [Anaerococcus sp.]|nr:RnfABCDGE type electron transport complex subunit B [Peptoniphilaceae bacterium]MDY3055408.1 RnfABCDGE type electron transport complex subunit B [Anaerococcus sp.]
MTNVLIPVAVLAVMGLLFAIMLGQIATKFEVKIDDTEEAVLNALPGANCGACGYPGCAGCAKAIRNGEAEVSACVIGGPSTTEAVAKAMGVDAVGSSEKMIAVVKCNGTCENAKDLYDYAGLEDCRAQISMFGGKKACNYGCLGCGSCVKACQFDAIYMVDGVALVDREKCVGCEACFKTCPKEIISMVPYSQRSIVKCSSHDKGKDVRSNCKVGCIGCTICAKTYPEGFTMDKFLSKETISDDLDLELLKQAAEKCPMKCIDVYE